MRGLFLAVRLIRNLQTNHPRDFFFAKRIGRLRIHSDRGGSSSPARMILVTGLEVLEPRWKRCPEHAEVDIASGQLHTGRYAH